MECKVMDREFLKRIVNELSMTNKKHTVHFGIAGNYPVKQADVSTEVIVFVLYYLEQRKCPHQLAVYLARKLGELLAASLPEEESCVEDCLFPTAATLQMVALDRLHKFCHQLLEKPADLQSFFSFNESWRFASVFAIKNKRRKMEDRHVVMHNLNALYNLQDCPSHSYYAVFDGHGGIDAASFAAAHLHVNIFNHPEFMSNTVKAIVDAYSITDMQFCQLASAEGLRSGCTAVSALLRNNTLYLAWLGDSQALLIKHGKPVTLMAPHTPDRQDERERIEGLGGFVCYLGTWRVNGTLAVSRALGDRDFKPYISSEPEVSEIHLDGTEDFLILACDGLWDGMTHEDVSCTLYETLSSISDSYKCTSTAKKLVYKSKQQGSDDNITAIVIFLRESVDICQEALKYAPHVSPALHLEDFIVDHSQKQTAECETMHEQNVEKGDTILQRPRKLPNVIPIFQEEKYDSEFIFGIPPEATALSELPTPPIDDIVLIAEEEKVRNVIDTPEPNKMSFSTCAKTGIVTPSIINSIDNDDTVSVSIAEQEAVEIASNVVTFVVESAIAQIDDMKISVTDFNDETNEGSPGDAFANPALLPCSPCAELDSAIPSAGISDSVQTPVIDSRVDRADSTIVPRQTELALSSPSVGVEPVSVPHMPSSLNVREELAHSSSFATSENVSQLKFIAENEQTSVISSGTNHDSFDQVSEVLPSKISLFTSDVDSDCSKIEPQGNTVKPEFHDRSSCSDRPGLHIGVNTTENLSSHFTPLGESAMCEELPHTAVAIDLNAVPAFVPEAECVVEDNDSDSEKDGGWSYVKATDNTVVDTENSDPPEQSVDSVAKKVTSLTKEKLKSPKQIPNSSAQFRSHAHGNTVNKSSIKTPISKGRVPVRASVLEPKQTLSRVSINKGNQNKPNAVAVPSKLATANAVAVPSKSATVTELVKKKPALPRENISLGSRQVSPVIKPSNVRLSKAPAIVAQQPQKSQLSNSSNRHSVPGSMARNKTLFPAGKTSTIKCQTTKGSLRGPSKPKLDALNTSNPGDNVDRVIVSKSGPPQAANKVSISSTKAAQSGKSKNISTIAQNLPKASIQTTFKKATVEQVLNISTVRSRIEKTKEAKPVQPGLKKQTSSQECNKSSLLKPRMKKETVRDPEKKLVGMLNKQKASPVTNAHKDTTEQKDCQRMQSANLASSNPL